MIWCGRHQKLAVKYTIQQLANLANTTVRTLHYYDEIGLLKPARIESNGYRTYEEKELLLLQQIMFFRELELSLEDIKKILENSNFDVSKALTQHQKLIAIKKDRLEKLLITIKKTTNKLHKKNNMNDKDLYVGFSKQELALYAKEAKERWGNTLAYRQSEERYGKLRKKEKILIQKETDELMREIVSLIHLPASDSKIQTLIDKHYASLRVYYEPNPEIYRDLAEMYVNDKRFKKYFDAYHENLARFMHDAMIIYCNTR